MSKFQRRHYEAIAQALRASKPALGKTWGATNRWTITVLHMGEMLQRDNPRFSRDRFHEACGLSRDGYTVSFDTDG